MIQLLDLNPEQKFQAVLVRFQEHSEVLRALKGLDLQVVGGVMTLQLALAAWSVDHVPATSAGKWGLVWLSFVLTALSLRLLYFNHRRRKEVVEGLDNTLKVLRFREEDIYLRGVALDPKMKFSPWFWSYVVALLTTFAGVFVVILFPGA